MPEGHTLHRLARDQQRTFGRTIVRASSPQGRFAEGSAVIDGSEFRKAQAHGKHLLHHYFGGTVLHVHLGLCGTFTSGTGGAPEPRGALRLRIENGVHWAHLRGAAPGSESAAAARRPCQAP